MSEALDKAKAAIAAAKETTNSLTHHDRLLLIAQTQATIAQAEALEHIAELLKPVARERSWCVMRLRRQR